MSMKTVFHFIRSKIKRFRKLTLILILVISFLSFYLSLSSLTASKLYHDREWSILDNIDMHLFTTTTTTTDEYARCDYMGFRFNKTVHNPGCPVNIDMNTTQRVIVDDDVNCLAEIEKSLENHNISVGGFYSPSHCKPQHKIAIIVPYRKRSHQLAAFMKHMHPFLQRQAIDYGIYFVEPVGNITFNRGLLLNIGFLESLKLSADRWDCFIFHDVDLLPEDARNFYTCPPLNRPRHMSIEVSSLDYK